MCTRYAQYPCAVRSNGGVSVQVVVYTQTFKCFSERGPFNRWYIFGKGPVYVQAATGINNRGAWKPGSFYKLCQRLRSRSLVGIRFTRAAIHIQKE